MEEISFIPHGFLDLVNDYILLIMEHSCPKHFFFSGMNILNKIGENSVTSNYRPSQPNHWLF